MRQNVLNLKKKQGFNKRTGCVEIKSTIFDIPAEVWREGNFDSFLFANGKTMAFSEFSQNRDNVDFQKEFNMLN